MLWIAKVKDLFSRCFGCSLNEVIKGLDCKTKYGEGEFGIPVKEIPLVDGVSALIQALGDGKADRGAAQAILGRSKWVRWTEIIHMNRPVR
ncbi:hypothetical protein [Streptomyces syringium]|uniref:hypothetical protein n=1 Tax=Streptomyces syringium TaxID=76729 RepID=UPI0034396D12